jgi:PAS domain S-box-containing protein
MMNNSALRTLNRLFPRLPLRQWLTIMITLPMVLGFIVLVIIGRERVRTSELRLVTTEQEQLVQSTANQISTITQALPETTITLSNSSSLEQLLNTEFQLQDPDLTVLERSQLSQQRAQVLSTLTSDFFEIVLRSPFMRNVRVFDTAGLESLRIERTQQNDVVRIALPNELQNVNETAYFAQSLLLDEYAVDVSEIDVEDNTPLIHLTTPIFYRGERAGGVTVDMHALVFMNYIIGPNVAETLGRDRSLVLLNSDGAYLADSRTAFQSEAGPPISPDFAWTDFTSVLFQEQEPELAQAFTSDVTGWQTGTEILSSYTFTPYQQNANVPGTPWKLIVIEDAFSALAPVGQFMLIFTVVALAILGGVVGLIWVITRAVVQPISEAASVADQVSAGDLSARIPIHREDEVGRLARAINSMTTRLLVNLATLEEQFSERTRDLEVTAEIANVAVGMRDVDNLLTRTVNLIRERFGFYHVQVFLVNDSGTDAELVASTGEAGQTMLDLNWSLGVGSDSVIGRVTSEGETIIALDTGDSEVVHRPNPHLPETRSEMALPMKYGEATVGALDIQSIYPNAFSQEDVRIFEILANQLAIAVNNARLLSETQVQIDRVEELNRRLTREAWDDFLDVQQNELSGYYGTDSGSGEQPRPETVSAPIQVRGEVIGTLNTAPPEGENFGIDEVALIEAVAERISLAVENARLVTETQVSLNETERLYQTSQAIASEMDAPDLVQVLYDNFGTAGRGITMVTFGAPGADGLPDEVRTLAAGLESGKVADITREVPPAQKPFFSVVSEQQVLTNPAAIEAAYPAPMAQGMLKQGIQALANFPIRAGGEWLGRLLITHTEPHIFSDREIEIFEALVGQIGTVLRSRRLFAAVETERQTLKSVLDTMPTAVMVLDASTRRPTLTNEQAVDLLGQDINFEQLLADHRLIHADSGEQYALEEIPAIRAIQGDTLAFSEDMAILQPDGQVIDVMSNAAPIMDANGNITAVVTVIQDITELRELQSALQDTLRETTALYESSKSIFAEQDLLSISDTGDDAPQAQHQSGPNPHPDERPGRRSGKRPRECRRHRPGNAAPRKSVSVPAA